MSQTEATTTGQVKAENIGGIDSTSVTFSPGITILSGRNATNRTSLLQAIATALGSENVSLKGDAEQGSVELTGEGETYSRYLEKTGNSIAFDGDPYLEDTTEADLFAFLLGNNEARREIVQEGDLREIIMRPVDTTAIQSRIEEYSREKQEIKNRLEEIESLKNELPTLEKRKSSLESQIEEKKKAIAEKEQEISEADADLEETKTKKQKREKTLSDLQDAQSELETVRRRIESEKKSISALKEKRESVQEEYEEFSVPDENLDTIEHQISDLRERKRSVEAKISQLQQIIQFNNDLLNEETETLEGLTKVESGSDEGAVTDQLLEESGTVCWTCGSSVSSDRIDDMLEQLRSMHKEMVGERNDLSNRIDNLQQERKEITQKREQRTNYENKLDDLSSEIERRKSDLEDLEEREETLETEVEEREQRVNEFEEKDFDELLSLQKELTSLELDLSSLEDDRESVIDEIESIETEISEEETLRAQHAEIKDELADLRTRIDDLEREAVEGFNKHMETVLDVLEYENVERIWIERVQKSVRNGRRKEQRSMFKMHIVRETEDGKSYEDTVHHLSESEREVTGLVFALAGYLVHDVHEKLPFMLLDSLEALDSNRIAKLVEYFSEYVDYLFVALLPEDAQALPERCHRITDI